ncbi:type II toxin-antitoxin system HicB family antitoxin [Lysobacter sp. A6]|uniref:Type II toxin-antitoxin system HicB family antitoxin n=1 Tax=Noviluteimonas lactosilytica TaxID=2888523 RepID=A0ABS8JJ09_9GAMM|nr:type II toxin-antitoxin system HicB family antitoxin [Lysobacter lactosilyticus]MCC8363591.1 type II toxin-antitoxin system HicB family antitoxin [Lysobacter lactosilyticus]
MLVYPLELERDGKGWFVCFPDIPEALTSGRTKAHAMEMAQDALETAMEFYFEDHRPVPLPSKVRAGQAFVELPASLSAKVLLLNEMLAQQVTPAELARRLETTPQSVQRIIDLDHVTKIDTIAEAFRVLGRRLDFQVKRLPALG